MLFRGQTTHYPQIIPSLFRKPLPKDYDALREAAAQLYLTAYKVAERFTQVTERDFQPLDLDDERLYDDDDYWGRTLKIPSVIPGHGYGGAADHDPSGPVLHRFTDKDDPVRHAILQHYGAPTPALDVSYDPRVAFWFATNRFRSDPSGIARYYPSKEIGVVYLIDTANATIVDLRQGDETLPTAGLRARRQAGALLLGATSAQPDLMPYVVETLDVSASVLATAPAGVQALSQAFLFPPSNEDSFFNALLDARFSTDVVQRDLAKHFVVYV
jgi:hypothetical protein